MDKFDREAIMRQALEGWKEKVFKVQLYSSNDLENYGENFCEAFNSGVHAAVEEIDNVLRSLIQQETAEQPKRQDCYCGGWEDNTDRYHDSNRPEPTHEMIPARIPVVCDAQNERKAFEEWLVDYTRRWTELGRELTESEKAYVLKKHDAGDYTDPISEAKLIGWMARASLLAKVKQQPQAQDEFSGAQPPDEAALQACITYLVHGSADFSGLHGGLVSYYKTKVDELRASLPAKGAYKDTVEQQPKLTDEELPPLPKAKHMVIPQRIEAYTADQMREYARQALAAQGGMIGYKPEGNWPEDFTHENGDYFCNCVVCGCVFRGYKRRVTCKVCSSTMQQETVFVPMTTSGAGIEVHFSSGKDSR